MKKIFISVLSLILLVSFAFVLPQKRSINSEAPTNFKDTLSSSQLSYFARVGAGTTMGENIVKVNTSTGASRTTDNLFENDIVCIGNSATTGCTQYTVKNIGTTQYFQINTTLPATNAFVTNYIVATRSARHVITFTPQTNITGGKWQFLLRATNTSGEKEADGMPDMNGFDLGGLAVGGTGVGASLATADITCPFGATASIGATVSLTASNGTTYGYHNILCSLAAGATNPIGSAATWSIGGASITNATQISNPSPNHTAANEGVADVYNFFIRHLDAGSSLFDNDTARGQIAVVESVRVTATVDPTISFIIDNSGVTGVGTSVCLGAALSTGATNTTATQVPFGSLKLQEFNDLAQRVSATTNAVNGYIVTVYEDARLTMVDAATTIPDTTCDSGTACTTGLENTWADATQSPSKFGYSLTSVPGAVPNTLTFTTSGNKYRPFPVGASNAVTIFNNSSTPTAWERAYVCYRLTITNFQPAGNYENKLVYTATATF